MNHEQIIWTGNLNTLRWINGTALNGVVVNGSGTRIIALNNKTLELLIINSNNYPYTVYLCFLNFCKIQTRGCPSLFKTSYWFTNVLLLLVLLFYNIQNTLVCKCIKFCVLVFNFIICTYIKLYNWIKQVYYSCKL